METPNKEQVYDDQINPLMTQILDICDKHHIAMIAQFVIPSPDDPELVVSSITTDESGNNHIRHSIAAGIMGFPGFQA